MLEPLLHSVRLQFVWSNRNQTIRKRPKCD